MLVDYVSLVLLLGIGVVGVATLYGGHRLSHRAMLSPQLPFLSGELPTEHALSRFHARWYVATLIFLAFDVEMLFMYPWSVVVAIEGVSSVVEMFAFLGVLLVGVLWAWREGAFRWA